MLKATLSQKNVIALKSSSKVSSRRIGHRSTTIINHAFLSKGIISQEHGRFCGMVVTDSHINKKKKCIEFSQQLSDYEMLQKMIFLTASNIKVSFSINKYGHGAAALRIVSNQMVHDVLALFPCNHHDKAASFGSSFELFESAQSSDGSYLRGYLMGVSDGDGCFGFHLNQGTIL